MALAERMDGALRPVSAPEDVMGRPDRFLAFALVIGSAVMVSSGRCTKVAGRAITSRWSKGMPGSCSLFSVFSELRLANLIDPKKDLRCGFVAIEGTGVGSRVMGSCSVAGAASSVENQSGSSSMTSCRRGLASREEALPDRFFVDLAK